MNFGQDIEGRYTRRGAEVGENGGGNTEDPDKVREYIWGLIPRTQSFPASPVKCLIISMWAESSQWDLTPLELLSSESHRETCVKQTFFQTRITQVLPLSKLSPLEQKWREKHMYAHTQTGAQSWPPINTIRKPESKASPCPKMTLSWSDSTGSQRGNTHAELLQVPEPRPQFGTNPRTNPPLAWEQVTPKWCVHCQRFCLLRSSHSLLPPLRPQKSNL